MCGGIPKYYSIKAAGLRLSNTRVIYLSLSNKRGDVVLVLRDVIVDKHDDVIVLVNLVRQQEPVK